MAGVQQWTDPEDYQFDHFTGRTCQRRHERVSFQKFLYLAIHDILQGHKTINVKSEACGEKIQLQTV
jgi:hypothetical protein